MNIKKRTPKELSASSQTGNYNLRDEDCSLPQEPSASSQTDGEHLRDNHLRDTHLRDADDYNENDHGAKGPSASQQTDGEHLRDADGYTFIEEDIIYPYYDKTDVEHLHWATRLPHWHQDYKYVFVTFRLVDSIPQEKIILFKEEKELWLKKHPKPWSDEVAKEYKIRFSLRIDKWLDNNYGNCILADAQNRKIVEDALFFFNDKRYHLKAFVVMPNHVHILMQLFNNYHIESVLKSIKSYTAKKINHVMNRNGRIWQAESFDRLIRNEDHYKSVLKYIIANNNRLAWVEDDTIPYNVEFISQSKLLEKVAFRQTGKGNLRDEDCSLPKGPSASSQTDNHNLQDADFHNKKKHSLLRNVVASILIPLLLLLSIVVSCTRHNGVTFEGCITGADGRYLTVSRTCAGETLFTDSVQIRNGSFSLTLPSGGDGPDFYDISLCRDNTFTTLADKGDTVHIEADACSLVRSYRATGSPDAERMGQLDHQLALFADSTDYLMVLYNQQTDDDSLREAIEWAYLQIKANHTAFLRNFIAQNSESLSCLAAFYQRYNQCIFLPEKENVELLQELYGQWKQLYPENKEVQWVGERLEKIKGK